MDGRSPVDAPQAEAPRSGGASPRLSSGLQIAFLGGIALPDGAAPLCRRIGALLAAHAHVTVATSGYTGRRAEGEGSFTWLVGRAFADRVAPDEVGRRMLTYVVLRADGTLPRGYESLGRQVVARGRHRMHRQAQIVARSDIVCTAGGSTGTSEFVRLALLIDRPVLPLPFFGGASRDLWFQYREEIQSDFGLPEPRVARWSQLDATQLSVPKQDALAQEVVGALLESRRGNCLVCMPFAERYLPVYERVVRPAVAGAHLYPVRMDQEPTVGDIVDALRAEIGSARCLVAVLDERNPNVMYEVGFAHAQGKPVVLLQAEADGSGTSREPALPFDIRTHRVVSYPQALEGDALSRCVDRLQAVLRAIVRAD